MEKVNVIGLGYIGLPTALSLSVSGNEIIGTDYNSKLVNNLQNGTIDFVEEGIKELYNKAVENGIIFTTEYQKADIYLVAVPTPYEKSDKKVDPTYVVNAVSSIVSVCDENAIIIIESTISPGTIDRYIRPIVANKKINLVHAPERIIPGKIVEELKSNSRTIGADDIGVAERIKKLYSSFCQGNIVTTDIRTAEMTKVVENTYRDINIAFANELTKICRQANLDVYEIIRIANMHPRVNILNPGPGVGGHCISVDPWFLVGDYPGLANIILAARKINDSMPEFVLERTYEIMKENHIDDISRVGFYGLTYKENVDDTRESPTLQLLESMKKHLGGGVKVYDPYVKQDIIDNQFHELSGFLEKVDIVVIMVGHDEIKKNKEKLKEKIVFDTRNCLNLEKLYHL
jgi:UDP-N-acetyl-D-mannosaminuronic acid dehydrogenase